MRESGKEKAERRNANETESGINTGLITAKRAASTRVTAIQPSSHTTNFASLCASSQRGDYWPPVSML